MSRERLHQIAHEIRALPTLKLQSGDIAGVGGVLVNEARQLGAFDDPKYAAFRSLAKGCLARSSPNDDPMHQWMYVFDEAVHHLLPEPVASTMGPLDLRACGPIADLIEAAASNTNRNSGDSADSLAKLCDEAIICLIRVQDSNLIVNHIDATDTIPAWRQTPNEPRAERNHQCMSFAGSMRCLRDMRAILDTEARRVGLGTEAGLFYEFCDSFKLSDKNPDMKQWQAAKHFIERLKNSTTAPAPPGGNSTPAERPRHDQPGRMPKSFLGAGSFDHSVINRFIVTAIRERDEISSTLHADKSSTVQQALIADSRAGKIDGYFPRGATTGLLERLLPPQGRGALQTAYQQANAEVIRVGLGAHLLPKLETGYNVHMELLDQARTTYEQTGTELPALEAHYLAISALIDVVNQYYVKVEPAAQPPHDGVAVALVKTGDNTVLPTTSPARLRVDREHNTATLDNTAYPITADQAIILHRLLDAKGNWCNGRHLNPDPAGKGRPDRIIKRLPQTIRDLIKSEGPKGYCLTI